MRVIGITDTGLKRAANEDNFRGGQIKGSTAFAFVCDGMGGANCGEVASDALCRFLEDAFFESLNELCDMEDIKYFLFKTLEAGNTIIFNESRRDVYKKGMGTTVVAAVTKYGILHLIHAGDSRAYMLRGDVFKQLTCDHSVVQEMCQKGELTEEEAANHPQKNFITRAMGVEPTIQLDYNAYETEHHDIILLCSDGLTNCASDSEIKEILSSNYFYDIPEKLVEQAKAGGGSDNITAVLMLVESEAING